MKADDFVEIPYKVENLDIYFIRMSILRSLKETLSQFKGKLLDIGCGKMPYKELIINSSGVNQYIGLDIEEALVYDATVKPDFIWDGKTMPFDNSSFDCIFGTEVLEHCFEPEVILNEVYRVLKPGGVFFFTIPFVWNLHEVPHDAYRYTPFALEKKLNESRFNEIKIKAFGGWNSSLSQMLGLWVRRSPMNRLLRYILSLSLLPIIWILIKKDKHNFGHSNFNEGVMIPGLFGICKK